VYSKDSTVPAQEPFEPEGGSSNPHTAEKGCLALFHIWDGDQCFNEEFRSKFDECIASAGVANMADEILEPVLHMDDEILAPAAPQPVLVAQVPPPQPVCGGHSSAKPADDQIRGIIGPLKVEAQSKAQASGWNGLFAEFEVHSYTSQVVAGTIFNVKVGYGAGKYAHVRVFRPLPHTGNPPEVQSVEVEKSEGDAL